MAKLACPYVSRMNGGRASASVFNEGISVPKKDWDAEVKKNPALGSTDRKEQSEATTKSILTGSLAKYRRR